MGPTSWFQAVLNAPNTTFYLTTEMAPLVAPWVVAGGNADNSFNATSGLWQAPNAGVYEVMFSSGFYTDWPRMGYGNDYKVTLKILINGGAQTSQVLAAAGWVGSNFFPISTTGIFFLQKDFSVQISMYTRYNNGLIYLNTNMYPQNAGTIFNVKSLF